MIITLTIAELLDKSQGRDALVHVLTAMDGNWPRLNDGLEHDTEYWLLAAESVRLLQNVDWLASAIIHVAKLHGASVGPQSQYVFDSHVCVWYEYTLHPVTNKPIDQVVAWFDEDDELVIHSMDSARKVLLTILRMDASKRDVDAVYALLRGAT